MSLGYDKYGSAVDIAAKQQDILQALQKQGITITPKVREEALALAQAYTVAADAAKVAQERHSAFEEQLNSFKGTAESAFTGLIAGAHSLREALAMVVLKLAEMAASQAFESLWNGGGKSVSGGLLGIIFGGARAGFGPVTKGNSYVVGERGREIFTPDQSGVISPEAPFMPNSPASTRNDPSGQEIGVKVWVDDDGKLRAIAQSEGYKGGSAAAMRIRKEVPSIMADHRKRFG